MYVSMYVYVPGGALRLKRCVIEAPNSPRAAFFSFASFFSCWCFLLPAFDSSEPPFLLPLALIATFPFFWNPMVELRQTVACDCFKFSSYLIPRVKSAKASAGRAKLQWPHRDQFGGGK